MNDLILDRRGVVVSAPAPAGDALGLRAAFGLLWRHRVAAFSAAALALLGTLAYVWLALPVYRADTLLQIDSRNRTTLVPNLQIGERSSGSERDDAAVAGEIEILRSREVLLPVIAATGADVVIERALRWGWLPVGARHGVEVVQLKLPESRRGQPLELEVEAGGTWALRDAQGQVLARGASGEGISFGFDTASATTPARAPAAPPGAASNAAANTGSIEVRIAADAYPAKLMLRQLQPMKAYEAMVDRMRAFEPAKDSKVVRISYEDTDPERAAAVLNAQVAGHLDRAVARRASDGSRTLAFLENQLPMMRGRIEAAEDALAAFQRGSAAIPLGTEAEGLTRQRGDLERQQIELEIKRDALAQTYTAEHNELRAVNAQLANVRRALARVRSSVDELPGAQRTRLRLQREIDIQAQQYSAVLAQVQQLRIADASWLASARQADRATPPIEPVRPKTSAVVSIGAALAALSALIAALIARSLRTTVVDTQELEQRLGPPTIATVPMSANQALLMDGRLREAVETDIGTHRLLARAAPQDPAIEGLRTLLLSLTMRARTLASKVILVTSPTYGAGNGFIASNLAALMAETGKRILLVETDLRSPSMYRYVDLDLRAPGLTDVLYGMKTLDEVIVPHATANLDALLQGSLTDNPGALLMTEGLGEILRDLRQRYDHIVLHAAPLLGTGDALSVGRLADCALLVVRAEQSLVNEVQEAVQRLERGGIRLEGLIFNGARPRRLTPYVGSA
jgi:tyrosine-protein kinase Etk/Wzc